MVKTALIIFVLLISQRSFADEVVRVAILDTLISEKIATHKYLIDYHKGLELAAREFAKNKIKIEYKVFEYEKEPLAILKVLPAIKEWHPHLIVGPRTSSLFLLLRDQFEDILVISPLATANDIAKLPHNFYSISPSNEVLVKSLVSFASRKFAKRPVQPIAEQDCKNCVDFVTSFLTAAKGRSLPIAGETKYYIEQNVETVDLTAMLKDLPKNAIFLLPNRSYTSGVLMGRISNQLKKNGLIFLGGDGWGDWSAGYTGKFHSQYQYKGYRLAPWSLDVQDPELLKFLNDFRKAFKSAPGGTISYISYQTVMTALRPNLVQKGSWTASTILKSFLSKAKSQPNYGRPSNFGVYELTQSGETLVQTYKPGLL